MSERDTPAPEVALILEHAADHAGASAKTYRALAELMKRPGFGDHPGFGHPLVNVTVKDGVISGVSDILAPVDLAKAMRDAYGRGAYHARCDEAQPEAEAKFISKRDAWIRQYMARLPVSGPADRADISTKMDAYLSDMFTRARQEAAKWPEGNPIRAAYMARAEAYQSVLIELRSLAP